MRKAEDIQDAERLQGLATWMLPPAPDWRRKLAAYRRHHLLPPILGLLLSLALLALTSYLAWQQQAYSTWLFALQLTAVTTALGCGALLLLGIQRQLVDPFAQLRDWATRVRNGNVAARLPQDSHGEFGELAYDLNHLGSSLQSLSQNLEAEVRRQTEHIAQKTHSLQVLYDVAASLNASRDLKDLLTRFLYTMRDIVNAKAGTVRLLIDDDQMELVASIGLDDEVVAHERIVPVKRCLCGNAVDEGEVLFQQDLLPCQQFVGRPLLMHSNLGMIAVPLQYRGKNLGVYNLFIDKSEFEARDEVKALFTSIGRHLGMAIEKARLDSESKRLSIMQERNTLAHELHDSLAQTLASLRFQVSMLPSTLSEEGTAAASREIEQIKNGLDEAYTELRELLAHFRAPIDARGLLPAIEDMVSQFRKQTGIHTFLQKEWDSTRLPANLEMQVLRIVQESLANIRKHSHAQNVRIMLRCNAEGHYRVLIEDDGVGMREPAFSGHPGEHIGLSIMQERARYLGGELRIESEEGEGTRVVLTFRYPDPKHNKEQQRFALI
ncbi:MAG: histidine kinase [Gammaproteobacteria bacterium HGW-Gammaproteobacteria-1]|jgi:two-component system nitrate/nitrite sensor histidine kinase NarX|nr:MAG: histidine kinase [Gammaproteobacteria bacterium HGW-Gammaproteobacteria-1]